MKPSIQEVLPLFVAYHSANPTWDGELFPIMAEGTVDDNTVCAATDRAIKRGDVNTYLLGLILMQMTERQRLLIPGAVGMAGLQ